MYITIDHRGKSIRVFLFGNYEFLCRLYGISGLSGKQLRSTRKWKSPKSIFPICNYIGRHCCLWCTVTSKELKTPCEVRGHSPLQTLETMKSDLEHFETAGSDVSKAKLFNNVISPCLFDISLDQVNSTISLVHIALSLLASFVSTLRFVSQLYTSAWVSCSYSSGLNTHAMS